MARALVVVAIFAMCAGVSAGCGEDPRVVKAKAQAAAEAPYKAEADRMRKLDEDREAGWRRTLAGKWVAKVGDEADGGARATMTLDVRADGTFTLVNAVKLDAKLGGDRTNTSEGSWVYDRGVASLTMERSPDGREIPAGQRELKMQVSNRPETPNEARTLCTVPQSPKFEPASDAPAAEPGRAG